MSRAWVGSIAIAALVSACAAEPGSTLDAAPPDAGTLDAALADAAAEDAGAADAAAADAARADAGPIPSAWPESSVCVLPEGTRCTGGVRATAWAGDSVYTWTADADELGSTLVRHDGASEVVVARITSPSWHVPSGLSVAPDGTIYLAAPFLGMGTVQIGATSIELPYTYDRVLVSLTSEGAVRWHRVLEGGSSERLLVAARHDGRVAVAGDLLAASSVGPFALLDPEWSYDFLVASIDDGGSWLWASQLPRQGGPTGDFQLGRLGFDAAGDIAISGVMRRDLVVDGVATSCDAASGCDAVITYSPEGAVLGLELAP